MKPFAGWTNPMQDVPKVEDGGFVVEQSHRGSPGLLVYTTVRRLSCSAECGVDGHAIHEFYGGLVKALPRPNLPNQGAGGCATIGTRELTDKAGTLKS